MDSINRSLLVLFIILWMTRIRCNENGLFTYEVDLCTLEELQLQCQSGDVIYVMQVRCGDQPCEILLNQTLYQLCHGHQGCSNLGLQSLLGLNCSRVKQAAPHVQFKCLKGRSASCRANICSRYIEGVRCPADRRIHIEQLSCGLWNGPCPSSTYETVYLCEGSSYCATSGLKQLLEKQCTVGENKGNVTITYVCIPDDVIENKCSLSGYRRMDADYGVLTTPVSQRERRPSNRPCRWFITGGGILAVTIHYLGVHTSTCKQVLKINYMDCGLELAVTRSFCKPERATFKSCGEVTISSHEMRVEGSMERFIISYHRYFDRDLPPQRYASCSVPSADDVIQPPGVIDHGSPEDKSVNLTKKLKLLIVYVVFGVVILALLVALIAVIISYCRLPKSETCAKEISETTVLWRNTPLKTFQTNNFLDGSILSHTTYITKHDTQEMVSHVHSDAIYENEELDHSDAIYENEELDHRMSNAIDMSDFLSVKKVTDFNDLLNTLQACSIYDELTNQTQELYQMPDVSYNKSQENEASNNIYECIDRDNFRKTNSTIAATNHCPAPVSGQEKHQVDGYHYCVNNDEYAIVQKYRKNFPDHIRHGFQSNTLEHNSSMALCHYEKLADSKR